MSPGLPLVFVTRPLSKGRSLIPHIDRSRCEPVLLPALIISPNRDSFFCDPKEFDLVMFVSGQALQCYVDLALSKNPHFTWPIATKVATVGRSSYAVMKEFPAVFSASVEGFYPSGNEAGFYDSEALWEVLQTHLTTLRKVLIVRAQGGRDWLIQRFMSVGVEVQEAIVYKRYAYRWTSDEANYVRHAAQSQKRSIWLVTSRDSLDALYKQWIEYDVLDWIKEADFIVIHPKIADYLSEKLAFENGAFSASATISKIHVCPPQDVSILRTIDSIL